MNPTLLEHLPNENFLQIFIHLSFQEIITAFSDLNSHVNSLIRFARDVSHKVRPENVDSIDILQSYPTQISRLEINSVANVDFTLLNNLPSLTLNYGTKIHFDMIHPQQILIRKGNL